MSKNWVNDISKMHQKFGVNEWVEQNKDNKELMREYLMFRVNFLQEELTEIQTQMHDPEEVVDGLVDLCVVAIGTMDAFGIDANKAWDTVHKANMAKKPGVKEERPNKFGLPDLVKPKGWKSPSHKGNVGLLDQYEFVNLSGYLKTPTWSEVLEKWKFWR